jgi:hypothetical protein
MAILGAVNAGVDRAHEIHANEPADVPFRPIAMQRVDPNEPSPRQILRCQTARPKLRMARAQLGRPQWPTMRLLRRMACGGDDQPASVGAATINNCLITQMLAMTSVNA